MTTKFLMCCVVLIVCFSPLCGQVSGSTTMESSVVIGAEVKKANLLEKIKAEIEYCEINLGRSFKEVDAARVGAAYEYNSAQVTAITNGLIASKYEAYGDLYKAAEYYYKDYLSETNPKKYWKSKHAWSSPGDFMPFPGFMSTLKQNQDYRKMLKAYPEYFNYSFLGRIKGPNGRKMSKEEEINKLKENMAYDLELKRIYDSFMDEWGVVRKLAKTEDPKPLTPAVQNHEWFYSDKQEEVLKALAYYSQNKVRFMLEKALSHKDPVVAAKAKEYLEELTKGEKNEIENKKH